MLEKTDGIKMLIHNSGGKKTDDNYNKTVIVNKGKSDPFASVDIQKFSNENNFAYTNDANYLIT